METKIHTSKKLEKLLQKVIQVDPNKESARLGKWKATLFYVNRKKCLLPANARTQYNVILTDFKTSDLKYIEMRFKVAFYEQLRHDEIEVDANAVNSIIGNITFHKTDNDRKANGFLSYRIQELEYWKSKYERFENMPFKKITQGLNGSPTHIGVGQKMADYVYSIDEMKKLLGSISNDLKTI